MKKIAAILLIVVLGVMLTVGLTACNEDDEFVTVRLNEVTHSVFYAPLYVA